MSDIDLPTTPVNQAFLVGPAHYLRLAEPDDAPTAAIWRDTPFPIPTEVTEEQLREEFGKFTGEVDSSQRMLICRNADDQPVGSVELSLSGWRLGEFDFSLDRLAPAATQDAVMAEVIEILTPWMLQERNLMVILIWISGDRPLSRASIEAHGGREHIRHRERHLFDGKRHDQSGFQIFNPSWVEKLGMPPAPEFGVAERETPAPARPSVKLDAADRPPGALIVGEKLYLRAVDPEEGKLVARWTREETEVYYPEGRLLYSAHKFGEIHRKIAESDPPDQIRFAIVLRENDEMIGCNGLESISWVHRYAETETEIFRPEHRNAGYGTEAKHLLLEFAFEHLGLHGVMSYVAETNPRSANALRKQGYRDAGTVEWDSFCGKGLCKYLTFDLLAREWRDARDRASGDQTTAP